MDEVTIIHGDSIALLPELEKEPISWVVTDPPYGIGFAKGCGGKGVQYRKSMVRRQGDPINGDDKPFDPSPWLDRWPCIFFGANHFASRLPEGCGSWHVWDKRAYSTIEDSFADIEFIWCGAWAKSEVIEHLWKGVQQASEKGKPKYHVSQKPVRVMRHLIERYTKPGDLILDPYAGSGSTAIAALQCGRRCIAIECEDRYIPTIHDRVRAARTPLLDLVVPNPSLVPAPPRRPLAGQSNFLDSLEAT